MACLGVQSEKDAHQHSVCQCSCFSKPDTWRVSFKLSPETVVTDGVTSPATALGDRLTKHVSRFGTFPGERARQPKHIAVNWVTPKDAVERVNTQTSTDKMTTYHSIVRVPQQLCSTTSPRLPVIVSESDAMKLGPWFGEGQLKGGTNRDSRGQHSDSQTGAGKRQTEPASTITTKGFVGVSEVKRKLKLKKNLHDDGHETRNSPTQLMDLFWNLQLCSMELIFSE